MIKDNKEHLIYGGILLGAVGLYLFKTKDVSNEMFSGIEGLNIDLSPDRILDSSLDKFIEDDKIRNVAKNIASKLSYKLLDR